MSGSDGPVAPARDVYSGGSWSEIMASKCLIPEAQFFIASAGYGLIELETPISSYQATFQRGSADSVYRNWGTQKEANREWWEALNGAEWHTKFIESKGLIIVQLSSVYLDALLPGFQKLSKAIGEKLVFISPGYKYKGSPLVENFLPIDTRFEHILKCTRSQLGASTLRWLLAKYDVHEGWNINAIKKELAEIADSLPDLVKHNRITLKDEEVIEFIERHHQAIETPAATPLLKILRDSNFACEQSRFSNLFKKWKSAKQANDYV